jgi:hypothetical protein
MSDEVETTLEPERRTRTRTEVVEEELEEFRCTGPCGDWYPDEELRLVKVEVGDDWLDGPDHLERPVCRYCSESLWGIPAETSAPEITKRVEMIETMEWIGSGSRTVSSALMGMAGRIVGAVLTVGLVFGVPVIVMGSMLTALGDSLQSIETTGAGTEPAVEPLFLPLELIPDVAPLIFILAIGIVLIQAMAPRP